MNKKNAANVNKLLSGEERTLLENIQSLIGQLMGSQSEAGATEGEEGMGGEVEMAMAGTGMNTGHDEPDGDEGAGDKKFEEAMKALGYVKKEKQGEPDGDEVEKNETANADAEQRLNEDLPETTETAMSKIGKALVAMASKRPVQKSSVGNEPVLNGIMKALKVMTKRIESQDKALGNLLDALNVSDDVMKSIEVQTASNRQARPVANTDASVVAKAFAEALEKIGVGKSERTEDGFVNDRYTEVKKSREELGNTMRQLFSKYDPMSGRMRQ